MTRSPRPYFLKLRFIESYLVTLCLLYTFLPSLKGEEPEVRFRWINDMLLLTIGFTPEQDIWISQGSWRNIPEHGKFGSLNLTVIKDGREITNLVFTERITRERGGSEFSDLHEAKEKTTLTYLLHKNPTPSNEIVVDGKSIYGEKIQTDLKILEEGSLAQVVLHGSYKSSGDEFVLVKQLVSIPKRP